MECYYFLTNIEDSSADGRTPYEKRFNASFGGPGHSEQRFFQKDKKVVVTGSAKRCWLAFSYGMLCTQEVRGQEICSSPIRKNLRSTSRQKFVSKDWNPEKYKSTFLKEMCYLPMCRRDG